MNINQLPLIQNTSDLLVTKSQSSQTLDNKEIQEPEMPNPQITLEDTMNALFSLPVEENKIQRVRKNLGKKAAHVTDEELKTALTQFEFLANSWLDEFECEIFEGKTLKETLKLE